MLIWKIMASGFARIEEEKLAELIALLENNKQKIDNFGEVNLLALNEYEELDKRYQFLVCSNIRFE